jgi:hypothetical protein
MEIVEIERYTITKKCNKITQLKFALDSLINGYRQRIRELEYKPL